MDSTTLKGGATQNVASWDAHPKGGLPLTAGQPETRTYRLQLYDGDNPVGDYSDEVSVVTLP